MADLHILDREMPCTQAVEAASWAGGSLPKTEYIIFLHSTIHFEILWEEMGSPWVRSVFDINNLLVFQIFLVLSWYNAMALHKSSVWSMASVWLVWGLGKKTGKLIGSLKWKEEGSFGRILG